MQSDYKIAGSGLTQMKEMIRRMVISHTVQEGEQLPDIRELSSRLAVNPTAVRLAYRELEEEGCVRVEEGKGVFAASGKEAAKQHKNELLAEFDKLVRELSGMSVDAKELTLRVKALTGGKENID